MTQPSPLRVVVVGPPLSASGGIGRVMSYTLAALATEDLQLRVLDTRGLGSSPWSSILPLLRSCGTLFRLGTRGQVDVAHVNISSHGSALRKGLVVRVCRLARIPLVLHLHASSFPEFYSPLPGVAQRWVRNTFGLAARVIVLGQIWRTYVQDVLGVLPDRVTVLPTRHRAPLRPPQLGHGAAPAHRFSRAAGATKGLPELLGALAEPQLRDRAWRATIAGDGDVEAYCARATELGLDDRIVFPGWVGVDAVANFWPTPTCWCSRLTPKASRCRSSKPLRRAFPLCARRSAGCPRSWSTDATACSYRRGMSAHSQTPLSCCSMTKICGSGWPRGH